MQQPDHNSIKSSRLIWIFFVGNKSHALNRKRHLVANIDI